MGVDYYTCDVCKDNFDDCGCYYSRCNKCEHFICFWCQVDLQMRSETCYDDDDHSILIGIGRYWDEEGELKRCPFCLHEIVDDKIVMRYLLEKYDLSYNSVKEEIINYYKQKKLNKHKKIKITLKNDK